MTSDENSSDEDEADALWAEITKDIKEIDKGLSLDEERENAPEKARTPPKSTQTRPRAGADVPPRTAKTAKYEPETGNGGLDRNTAERLRRGQLPIEARLDLHGMTRQMAEPALAQFLHAQYVAGKRCILVITGKGPGKDGVRDPLNEGHGVLRQSVPQWLSEPPNRSIVLRFAPAKAKHGGAGALYVLLRRKR